MSDFITGQTLVLQDGKEVTFVRDARVETDVGTAKAQSMVVVTSPDRGLFTIPVQSVVATKGKS